MDFTTVRDIFVIARALGLGKAPGAIASGNSRSNWFDEGILGSFCQNGRLTLLGGLGTSMLLRRDTSLILNTEAPPRVALARNGPRSMNPLDGWSQQRRLSSRVSRAGHSFGRVRSSRMEDSRVVFFDPETIAILKGVLDDAWSLLPPGQTNLTRSLIAERILKAARDGERDPVRLRARAIADSVEGGPQAATAHADP